jgi:hypothetical protein
MRILKQILALFGMALGAGAIWLAVEFLRAFSAGAFFGRETWNQDALIAVLIVLGIALIFVAYDFGFRQRDQV